MDRATSSAALVMMMATSIFGCGGGRSHVDGGVSGDGSIDGAIWTPPAACEGRELDAPGVLDLDLPLLSIRGVVSIDGRTVSPAETSTLVLELHELDTDEIFTLAAPSLHVDGSYATLVPPGRYEISTRGLTTCELAPGLPCSPGVVLAGVTLTASGVLDLDLPTALVDVRVTFDGVPATAGHVRATATGGMARGRALTVIHAGAAPLRLLRGRYAFAYENDDCTGPAPCGEHALDHDVAIDDDGAIDIPVPVVHVSGATRLDGSPAASGLRVLFDRDGLRWASVANGGAYAATIVADTYDVGVDAPAEACRAGGALPCVPAILRPSMAFVADGVLDLDGDLVHLTGQIAVDGAPLSASSARLRVIGDAGEGLTDALGGDWGASVIAGTYAIHFDGDETTCGRITTAPCNDGLVAPRRAFSDDGVLDLAVDAVRLTGAVTGGPPRGIASLWLDAPDDEGDVRVPTSGASYASTLLAGRYAIDASDAASGCEARASTDCLETRVQPELSLDSDGVLDLTLSLFELQGRASLDVLEAAHVPVSVGVLHFTSLDGRTRATVTPSSGAYRLSLAGARYVASYERSLSCDETTPCGEVLADGCEALGRP